MNLKEGFRYQKFLDSLMYYATLSVQQEKHCLKSTKTHKRSKVNPDTEDVVETVEVEDFYPNDDVMRFMVWIIEEKEKLTRAIDNAKHNLDFDIDAAVAANKLRRSLASSIKMMLNYKPSKKIERGTDYKFNVEGNQVPYYYDVETVSEDAYDREKAKALMRSSITVADESSAQIDTAMVNTEIAYVPVFDVNESYADVMEDFIKGLC